ncbi:MAG: hypothetical protein ACQEXJ_12830 [Myxococcota bacterium]
MRRSIPALLFALLVAATAPASAVPTGLCPDVERPRIYMIGSSTMGSLLGPMLQRLFDDRWALDARRWGKASSGLARPDFHDWPKLAPGLMHRHRPDIVVVSLGNNDNQPIFVRRGRWLRMDDPEWREVYAERVRGMLDGLSGEDRRRMVVWIGPYAMHGDNAERMGPIINDIMRREVEAFDGPAVFLDTYAATVDEEGEPIDSFRREDEDEDEAVDARTSDGIHLTTEAVRWLLAEPILRAVGRCVDGDGEVAGSGGEDEAGGDGEERPAVEDEPTGEGAEGG